MVAEDNWRNEYPDEERDSDASSDSLEGSDNEDICRYHSNRRYRHREAIFGKLVFLRLASVVYMMPAMLTAYGDCYLFEHVQTMTTPGGMVTLRLTTGKLQPSICL